MSDDESRSPLPSPSPSPSRLSPSDIERFNQRGWLLLKGVLDADECEAFDRNVVRPALEKHAGVSETDPSTWNCRTNERLASMATGSRLPKDGVVSGVMVRRSDGGDPISDDDQRSLNLSSALGPILDQLHDANDEGNDDNGNDNEGKRRSWAWLHDNLGWIHVRFPVHDDDNDPTTNTRVDLLDWHVDGGHFDPHRIDSPDQSVIALPMIRPVPACGGGNTTVSEGSHQIVARLLAERGDAGLPRRTTQGDDGALSRLVATAPERAREIAPCDAGDVLLLHPFTVHAAGRTSKGRPLRIAFNVGTRWTRTPSVLDGGSVLETSLWRWLDREGS